ncbi:MAG: hypothetical protein HW421_3071 [Ignavibacteria bacterium]|nr:hypothetical protein [Ignavibacteria bacterium]
MKKGMKTEDVQHLADVGHLISTKVNNFVDIVFFYHRCTVYQKLKFTLFISIILISLSSCEDPVPYDYIPDTYIQAYLIVGEPIRNIVVMQTQPVNSTFDFKKSLIQDATVKIKSEGNEFLLAFKPDSSGYYFPDSSYLVKPKTQYSLEIILSDGKIMTSNVVTPDLINWVNHSPKLLQYPLDTVKLPAKDTIEWSREATTFFYAIIVKCLDTSNYGKYLEPVIDEKNRRVFNPYRQDNKIYEISSTALIPNTKTSIVWSIFKWFGKHEIVILAADYPMLEAFVQNMMSNQYLPNLNNINGGKGHFGSASAIKDTFMLLKNLP